MYVRQFSSVYLVTSQTETNGLEALIISNNADRQQKLIFESTRAIAFLGTPHSGSKLADLATIAGNIINVAKRTNTDILNILRPGSEVLGIITQDFHRMVKISEENNAREGNRRDSLRITCFIEELPVVRYKKTFMASCIYALCLFDILIRFLCRSYLRNQRYYRSMTI